MIIVYWGSSSFREIKSFAVFSEDGLPPNVSKGEKFVILASVFVVKSQRDNLAEQVIQLINNSFVRYIPSSIQVSRVSEIEIHQQNGIELEGVFENNEELNFLAFMVPTNEVYHIILAIATEKEKEDLYQKVREMLKTVCYLLVLFIFLLVLKYYKKYIRSIKKHIK